MELDRLPSMRVMIGRKTLDVLERLLVRHQNGEITDAQLVTAAEAVNEAVGGMMDSENFYTVSEVVTGIMALYTPKPEPKTATPVSANAEMGAWS